MLFAIPFPSIDPVLVHIGPLPIRWYALSYVAGLFLGWWYILRLNKRSEVMTRDQVDDLFVWVALGVLLGGRIGYVLFYGGSAYFKHPLEMLEVWKGGMSFHGGLLGVIIALVAFSRLRKINFLKLSDLLACTAPIGLFLGRLANFVNGELWGRPTLAPWGVIFPNAGDFPRHPSQIYEALMEGVLLFSLLAYLFFLTGTRKRPGQLAGVFLVGYGLARFLVEFVREPDAGMIMGLTRGQVLSLPMIAIGLYLIHRALVIARSGPDKTSNERG